MSFLLLMNALDERAPLFKVVDIWHSNQAIAQDKEVSVL